MGVVVEDVVMVEVEVEVEVVVMVEVVMAVVDMAVVVIEDMAEGMAMDMAMDMVEGIDATEDMDAAIMDIGRIMVGHPQNHGVIRPLNHGIIRALDHGIIPTLDLVHGGVQAQTLELGGIHHKYVLNKLLSQNIIIYYYYPYYLFFFMLNAHKMRMALNIIIM